MGIPFHIDIGPHINHPIITGLHFVYLDGNGMGHFIMGEAQDLFPDDFAYHDPFRLIRVKVFRIKARAFRHEACQFLDKGREIPIFQGR